MQNPFIGKRVLVRTYSAGVHIGTLVSADGMECQLADALRLWQWTDGSGDGSDSNPVDADIYVEAA